MEGDIFVVEGSFPNFSIEPQTRDATCFRSRYCSRNREKNFPYHGADNIAHRDNDSIGENEEKMHVVED